jgi:hypothetical protein
MPFSSGAFVPLRLKPNMTFMARYESTEIYVSRPEISVAAFYCGLCTLASFFYCP